MKKVILIIITILAGLFSANAQTLKDFYKQNPVLQLTADETYAKGNDWDKVFDSYYDKVGDRPIGNRKTLTVTEDGSALVSHYNRNRYSLFDKDGKFIKDIVIKDKMGKAISNVKPVKGCINGYFYTQPDNMGKMYFFDIEGNIIDELTLSYSANRIITLSDNKIAVSGSTSWKGKDKYFISIIDINTGKDNIIWELLEDKNKYSINEGKTVIITPTGMLTTMARKEVGMAYIDNLLYVSLPLTGEILTYDIYGNVKSKAKMTWADKYISAEEQKEFLQKIIDSYKENLKDHPNSEFAKHLQSLIDKLESSRDEVKDSIPAPAFSTMIKDSDNNLLFFEYLEDEEQNRFNVWVYNDKGYTCKNSLQCESYKLAITPSKLVFHNGYIYGIQEINGAKGGMPTRLVRFKIK